MKDPKFLKEQLELLEEVCDSNKITGYFILVSSKANKSDIQTELFSVYDADNMNNLIDFVDTILSELEKTLAKQLLVPDVVSPKSSKPVCLPTEDQTVTSKSKNKSSKYH